MTEENKLITERKKKLDEIKKKNTNLIQIVLKNYIVLMLLHQNILIMKKNLSLKML